MINNSVMRKLKTFCNVNNNISQGRNTEQWASQDISLDTWDGRQSQDV